MLSTLFIMLSGAVLCFILLLVLLSLRRTGTPGVKAWCVANALGIVAFTLYAFGRQLPRYSVMKSRTALIWARLPQCSSATGVSSASRFRCP